MFTFLLFFSEVSTDLFKLIFKLFKSSYFLAFSLFPWEAKININRVSASQLKSLNGIRDVTASRIVEYRSQNGNFKTNR
ncbi:ComEA family DNA-binding protein [Tepidibacter aestuarii]|uniref:ComEA family DNA-binding protein n=1 Tax=Tepidibacter aestuarii TaxID=2925782 RepID=UPI0038CD93D5